MPLEFKNGIMVPKPPIMGRTLRNPGSKHGPGLSDLKRIRESAAPRILIQRNLGGIGDVLMTTPSLRAIKHEWPDCILTYAADFNYMNGALVEVLQHNPYIDRLVRYNTVSRKDYDFAVNITSPCVPREISGARPPNRIDIFANTIGVSLDITGKLPIYETTEEERAIAHQTLESWMVGAKSLVGIQVKSVAARRTFEKEVVLGVARYLRDKYNCFVVLFDEPETQSEYQNDISIDFQVVSDTSIAKIAALVEKMDLMITPDSALMHFAGIFGVPNVAVFGSTDPNARVNYYPNAISLVKDSYYCWPCWYQPVACNGSMNCLHSFGVEEIAKASIECLNRPRQTCDAWSFRGVDTPKASQSEAAVIDTIHDNNIYLERKCGGYGDVICITCAARCLKEMYPNKDIVVVAPHNYHCVFDNNPDIARCITLQEQVFTPKMQRYDLSNVDAAYEVKTLKKSKTVDKTRPQIYLEAIGCKKSSDGSAFVPRLYVTEEEQAWAKQRFCKNKQKQYVLTTLNAAEEYRTWPYKHYLKLFELAQEKQPDWRFIVCGPKRLEDEMPRNVVDATGFDFRKAIILTSIADYILTPDTSLLHMSAAFDKPCVALFGPFNPDSRCKYYQNVHTVEVNLDCKPCWRNNNVPCQYADKVTGNQSWCLTLIEPAQVLDAMRSVFS